jgi:hypothetical protein
MLRQRGYHVRRLEEGYPEWKIAGRRSAKFSNRDRAISRRGAGGMRR